MTWHIVTMDAYLYGPFPDRKAARQQIEKLLLVASMPHGRKIRSGFYEFKTKTSGTARSTTYWLCTEEAGIIEGINPEWFQKAKTPF